MNTDELYAEEDYIMISGIQHYAFCRRQWALIHIEQQWKENILTIEGNIIHEKCHDEGFKEKRKNLIVTRGMRVYSPVMGCSGQCDIIEFHKSEEGAFLFEQEGYWVPVPIEYKHGAEKSDYSDIAQLCAQAMCLEEMLCCEVPKGYIYYAAKHKREEVIFDNMMRDYVHATFKEMHNLLRSGYSPMARISKKCNKCSLKDICLPIILKNNSVGEYYRHFLEE